MRLLRTLGTFGVLHDGTPIEALATHRKAMAILAILAAGDVVSRDRVMAQLWPDSDIDRARGSLKQAVHLLRRHLDAPDLLGGRAELSLARNIVDTDVHQFREALAAGKLVRAVEIYRGPFLDGIHFGGSSELEEWIDSTRATLAREFGGALERLAVAAEASGDREAAIEWWRQRQVQDPWDGRVALRLMQALVAGGQRCAALQHAQVHETLLRTDLDLAPDAAVMAYATALRSGDAGVGGDPVTRVPAVDRAAPLPSSTEARSTQPSAPGPDPTNTRRRWMIAAATALAVFAVFMVSRLGTPALAGPHQLDADLVAVAPFDVIDPSLDLWREGLSDVLAQLLDGAGPIRTVAPTVAYQRWSGRADAPSAEKFGAATGAGVVVFGRILRRGTDSIVIRVTVLDRTSGTSDRLEVAGAEAAITVLADSLGVQLLRTLGITRPIASVRYVSLSSRSLPALRHFLRAEQFYRAGAGDSALAHYDEAIREDSTFALALRRMAWLLGGGTPSVEQYASRLSYLERAVRFNRGLTPRDSLLLTVDSLRSLSHAATSGDDLLARLHRATAILEDLAQRYPDDPSVWYDLGEVRFHGQPPIAGDPVAALAAFDRAIALDSGFSPAYMHTVTLAIQLGQLDRARRYVRAYGRLNVRDRAAPALYLAAAILDSGGVNSPVVRRQLTLADAGSLQWTAVDHLSWWTDSVESAIAVLRVLVTGMHPPRGTSLARDSLMQRQMLSRALAFRGHLRDAARVNAVLLSDAGAAPSSHVYDPMAELAMLGALDDSLVQRTFARTLDPTVDWGVHTTALVSPRFLRGLPWWYSRRDTVSLIRFMARANAVRDGASKPLAVVRARYYGAAAAGYLALARADTAHAERLLAAIPDSLCVLGECVTEKVMLARLRAARGDVRGAAALLEVWSPAGPVGPIAVLTALEYARVAERMGNRTKAAERYRFVLDAWQRADPELQVYVREAQEGWLRIGAQKH